MYPGFLPPESPLIFAPFHFLSTASRLLSQPLLSHSPILRPAYLSSLKLLWLKPPNTPLRSLPITQNTRNRMIISPINLTILYSYQHKDTKKQPTTQRYSDLINNILHSDITVVPFILFRLMLVARAAGLPTIEFYPVLVKHAPDRAFAAETADSPDVVK